MQLLLYIVCFEVILPIQCLTIPTGCAHEAGVFKCDITSALPLNASSFDPKPQRLKMTNINGAITSADMINFDIMTSLTFDVNYAPSLEMECITGGALSLDTSSFTGFSWVAELRIINCKISSLGANIFQNLKSLNLLSISGGSITTIDPDTLSGVSIQKDNTVPSPIGEFALINVKINESLPETLLSTLTNITSITFINSGMTLLHKSTFSSLAKLSKVTVAEKMLTYLADDTFTSNNKGLGTMVLNDINWDCTCSRLWWMKFADNNKIALEGDMICSTGVRVRAYYDATCAIPETCSSGTIPIGPTCVTSLQIIVYVMTFISFLMMLLVFGLLASNKRLIKKLQDTSAVSRRTSTNQNGDTNSPHATTDF